MPDWKKIGLKEEEQEEYVLLQTKPYDHYYGWNAGIKVRRVSIWLSGNGCGVRQAYFKPVEKTGYEGIIWEDHVKPLAGQADLFEYVPEV